MPQTAGLPVAALLTNAPDYSMAYASQRTLVMDPSNPNRLLLGSSWFDRKTFSYQTRVFETTNDGGSWAAISQAADLSPGQFITALAIAPSAPRTIYAATSDGHLFVTKNDGGLWVNADAQLPWHVFLRGVVQDIRVSPDNPVIAYIVTDGTGSPDNVWRTANSGANWTNINGNVPVDESAHTLAVDWRFPTPVVYVGTDRAIYRSTDQGATWQPYTNGIPLAEVTDLELTPQLDTLTAATYGRGVFQLLVGGAPTHYAVNARPTTTAGASVTVHVEALDGNNVLSTGYTGIVHLSSSDGSAVLPPDYAFNSSDLGRHDFTVVLKTATTSTMTVTDKTTGKIIGLANMVVNPAPASNFQVMPTASQTAGKPIDVTVVALDPYGNIDPNYHGTVQISSDDSQGSYPAAYTFTTGPSGDDGRHTFSQLVTLKTAGNRTVTVTDVNSSTITGNGPIQINPAPATHFQLIVPLSAV